jgi:broad specificity phosphatase PhoE
MESKPVAYFVRHGSTTLNNDDCFRGPINAPLAENGISQGKELHSFFQDKVLGSAYSSDMDRVQHTADLAVGDKGLPTSITPDLRSWNVGKFAGRSKPQHQHEIAMYQDNPDEKIPQGESLNQFRNRVQPRIKTAIMAGIHTGVPSVVFTHSSVIHEVSHVLTGDHNYHKVKPGGVLGVMWNGKKLTAKALLHKEQGEVGYGA